ncbi:MAG: helix-turn-helix transcriptional regulator [Bacteroidota bacterium]
MNTETLRAKTKKYLEEEKVSIRKLAATADIDFSTLSRFLKGERDLAPYAMRRLQRAIDPRGNDLSLHATDIFRKYKRQFFNGDEIAIIGENLVKMGKVLASSSGNNLQQDATLKH